MSAVVKPVMSPEEYLAVERLADTRSEFYRGEMFAMPGASWKHALVKDNVAYKARSQLDTGPCHVVTGDLRVKIMATGLYTYPDIVIVCDEPQFEDKVMDTLLNPRTIVEVLSHSTEKYDRVRQIRPLQAIAVRPRVRAGRSGSPACRESCSPGGR